MTSTPNRRILLVDDMPSIHGDFRKIFRTQMQQHAELGAMEAALFGKEKRPALEVSYELDSAYQGQEAWAMVQTAVAVGRPYAMAFVDMRMPPGWDGMQTIEHLWQADARLQVVICTAYSDTPWDDLLARLDVRDRLLILKKPFEAIEVYQLASSLTAKWQMAEDMAAQLARLEVAVHSRTHELHAAHDSLQYLATHDSLTGLPNRSLLEDRLRQAMAYADRSARQVTVAMIDLDNFKLINDTLGHQAGDELLKTMAARMVACVRSVDTVGRQGGDEFVVVLFDQPVQGETGIPTLHRLRDAMAQPVVLGRHTLQITASMGLATYPADGADVEALLMNADAAMYRAKELGRNNYQFYATEMNHKAQNKLAMFEGLRNAMAQGAFQLVYQPKVALRTGQIIGVEALIRWQHPEQGVISPDQFIPLAEESGLIVPIGEWVLRTACMQNKAWQDAGMGAIGISVNVSARQFREKDLLKRVAQALEDSGLQAEYLELELTESLIMQDLEKALETMRALQAMGVQLSIDDFGTGYSSLSALKSFPIVRLKIDRAFVRDIPHDEDDQAIARAIISLGHELDLKVIAEGVETAQQLDFLRANHCDEIQGYYFSRPVPASGIEALLQARTTPEWV
ncbi:diguanylate cyclase (GGDEF) domain-containing protein [Rhodoferax sp. OV413]|uniref:putative bifunctional diguanylate cyclase/phosphodiesterase n=1 Tax=Rhodoferax sp. OV413 TaxID=1855285 RepID=UPI00087F033F|nr:EAL domain-containing protein [Rhodoferax sp. OV413]SDP39093.1 diguanylate cyclase (GGDEF) domain-containing protein [Rhodoferax sp. OV413]